MTDYRINLIGAFAPYGSFAEDALRGGLGDGYFYTTVTSTDQEIRLWQTADLTGPVDTTYVTGPSNTIYRAAHNNAGDCFVTRRITAGVSYSLAEVSNAGATLSVSSVGTVYVGTNQSLFVGADPSQVLCQSGGTAIAWSTSTAGTAYSVDTAASHATTTVLTTPAADYFLGYCSTHTDYELWDGVGGTVVSSLNDAYSWGSTLVSVCPISTHRTFVAGYTDGTDPKEFRVGVLSSSDDSLAWEWGPTTLTTNWSIGTAIDVSPFVTAWGNAVLLGPADELDSPPPTTASWYVVDARTGEVSASEPNVYAGSGIGINNNTGAVWAGSNQFVIWPGDANPQDWTAWLATPTSALLRQRQSPKRTPSRVRGPDLRQRQTPFIT